MASKKKPRTKSKNDSVWMTDDDDVWICRGCKKNSKDLTTNCWNTSIVINITALNVLK